MGSSQPCVTLSNPNIPYQDPRRVFLTNDYIQDRQGTILCLIKHNHVVVQLWARILEHLEVRVVRDQGLSALDKLKSGGAHAKGKRRPLVVGTRRPGVPLPARRVCRRDSVRSSLLPPLSGPAFGSAPGPGILGRGGRARRREAVLVAIGPRTVGRDGCRGCREPAGSAEESAGMPTRWCVRERGCCVLAKVTPVRWTSAIARCLRLCAPGRQASEQPFDFRRRKSCARRRSRLFLLSVLRDCRGALAPSSSLRPWRFSPQ